MTLPDSAAGSPIEAIGAERRLRQFFDEIYRPRHTPNASAGVLKNFRSAIGAFGKFADEERSALTLEAIDAFVSSLQQSGYSEGTVRNYRASLRALCDASAPELVLLETDAERSLSRFLETTYAPMRLRQSSKAALAGHRSAISRMYEFTGRAVTLDELSDELIERFMLWRLDNGRSPQTVNGDRACLLTLWRYAWRKKFVETQPRGIDKLETMKRLPEAWSLSELATIIAAAESEPGTLCDVPASLWWPALIQVNYDTGLRIHALLSIRVADVDFDAGSRTRRRARFSGRLVPSLENH